MRSFIIIALILAWSATGSASTPTGTQTNEQEANEDKAGRRLDLGPASAPQPRDPESLGQTLWRDFASPWTHARPFLLGGTALTLGLAALREPVMRPFQSMMVEDQPLGDSSRVGARLGLWLPNMIYAAGMLGHGWLTGETRSKRRSLLMFKTSAYSYGVTTLLKHTVREPRPFDARDRTAFPSAHAAAAFSFASVIQAEHGWMWGAPAYAMAAFVGASRINDNRHHLNDVVAGATIGIVYGLGISRRTREGEAPAEDPRQAEAGSGPRHSWSFAPTPDLRGGFVGWSKEF